MAKNKSVIQKLYKISKDSYYSPNNIYGKTDWQYHIMPVIKLSLILGRKLKANLEILEIAALLHDYAAIKDKKFVEDHHLYGAEFAQEILTKLNYPQDKIDIIKECIKCHRGSVKIKSNLLEARILASADAISHFKELPDMFYLVYGIKKLETREGAIWLKNKLQKSYSKIMPQGKDLIKADYKYIMKILNQTINQK